MASGDPPTAPEAIAALAELRPLVRALCPVARNALNEAITGIELQLKADADELRQLLSLSETEEMRHALGEQLSAIEVALSPPPAALTPPPPAPAPASKPPPKPSPAPKPSTAATVPPLDTRKRPPPAPALDTPPGGFDPHAWPEVPSAAEHLPADCFRSVHCAPMRSVPRCPFGSKAARALLEQRKPVILTHHTLVGGAASKWTLDYLCQQMHGLPCTVYSSSSRHFRYWDDEKNQAGYPFAADDHTAKLSMDIDEFRRRLAGLASTGSAAPAEGVDSKDSAAGDGGDAAGGDASSGSQRLYLQTALVDGVGAEMMADFRAFDWEGVLATQQRLGWGSLSSNLLLVGQKGNTTPCHYDEQQNLFAQLHGAKRVILFSPADFGCLYPFPMHHPCDRQSQVDLYAPDLSRFPRFRAARPLEAILQPGEVLYLPQYWWHHIENLDEACVSLNFWFKDCAKPEKVVLPLSASQHLAMRRNIEKLVAQKLGATKAQLVLPLLASHTDAEQPAESAVPEVGALREEVTRLLTHVMPAADVPAWLCELVEGRFPRLAHQETGQPI
jgi:hypoxia-inducible factor 1-alpha inhibitor (HIF hydroxylase)